MNVIVNSSQPNFVLGILIAVVCVIPCLSIVANGQLYSADDEYYNANFVIMS